MTRQLDAAPSAAEALPKVLEAVGGDLTVLVDSGIRSGHDLARAFALGAQGALLGRPFLWAVASEGEAGAIHAFHILADELRNVMKQVGAASLAELPARLAR